MIEPIAAHIYAALGDHTCIIQIVSSLVGGDTLSLVNEAPGNSSHYH